MARPARPSVLPGALKAPLPTHIAPQLATSADLPPQGDDWIHEIKFDGYRTMARIAADGTVSLITRTGLDWTERYGDLAEAFATLPCTQALIDGEIVVLDEKGVSQFSALQRALSDSEDGKLVFYAFDLVHLDGYSLVEVPLLNRKDRLAQLLAGRTPRAPIQFSDHVAGSGQDLYERASDLGLEGIVSKRASAPYRSGRSLAWIKTKALRAGDFTVVGYTRSDQAGGLGALAVADEEGGDLVFCGKVGTGFDAATMAQLLDRLEPLRSAAAPIDGLPKDVIAVKPAMSVHLHYAGRTAIGSLRHAVFKHLREARVPTRRTTSRQLISEADLASVWVSNPTRRLFGKTGATKLDVAVYYAHVGNAMLPHLVERPVSLVRCPSGRPEDCFFQRHAFAGMPASVSTFRTPNSDGEEKAYLAIVDAKGYLALAQFGVVEFHVWGSLRPQLETPNRIVFDLDPGEGVEWRDVVEAAVHVRQELEGLGLVAFVKTSGGKGLHVVVPVEPKLDWSNVHKASGAIAARIAKAEPQVFVTTMSKERRKRRIFIDFHRNARGATAAAPYSLRATPNLPVSTPLTWDDVESIDGPVDLNYSSVPGLLRASGEPWADMARFARRLKRPKELM
jgi:DNA ligase D